MDKKTTKRKAPAAAPVFDLAALVGTAVARPQTKRAVLPPMLKIHERVLGTFEEGDAVQVAIGKGQQEELVKQIRRTIWRNGHKDVSIRAAYGKDTVTLWAAEPRKRASRKKPEPDATS